MTRTGLQGGHSRSPEADGHFVCRYQDTRGRGNGSGFDVWKLEISLTELEEVSVILKTPVSCVKGYTAVTLVKTLFGCVDNWHVVGCTDGLDDIQFSLILYRKFALKGFTICTHTTSLSQDLTSDQEKLP